MVTDNHYRWDFYGLSTDAKPTPATSPKVVDGSTFYEADTSKLFVFCNDTWYEKTVSAGTSYTAGTGINITEGVISADQTVMATKSYVDGRVIQNAGAPTTATVGTVGQLLEDTTNGKLYQCTAVDTESDPAVYTWTIITSGYTIVSLTQAQYDALLSYDPSTIYIITEA